MMNAAGMAWVAGFLEADGWFGIHGNGSGSPSARMEATNCDRATLDTIVSLVGYGKVYGPYEQRGIGTQPTYKWRLARQGEVYELCIQLLPWIVSYKRDAIKGMVELLESRGYGQEKAA